MCGEISDEWELGERGKTLEAVCLGVSIDYIRQKRITICIRKVRSLARRQVRLQKRNGGGKHKKRKYLWKCHSEKHYLFTKWKITKMVMENFLLFICIYIVYTLHVYTCTICVSVTNSCEPPYEDAEHWILFFSVGITAKPTLHTPFFMENYIGRGNSWWSGVLVWNFCKCFCTICQVTRWMCRLSVLTPS